MKKLFKNTIETIKANRYSAMTQKQLAEAMGVSQSTISKIWNEKPKFKPFEVKAPAQELKEVLKQSANRIEELERDVRFWENAANKKSTLLNAKTIECRVWRKAAIGFLIAWGLTIVGGVLLILIML